MTFEILNETGGTVRVNRTNYANNAWVPITKCIGFSGIKHGRYDVDGPNAGRDVTDGKMIRDRIATKNKWELTLHNAISEEDLAGIYKLIYPVSFHIRTDIPYGVLDTYEVYSNNLSAQYLMEKSYFINGAWTNKSYYSGTAIPIVEM